MLLVTTNSYLLSLVSFWLPTLNFFVEILNLILDSQKIIFSWKYSVSFSISRFFLRNKKHQLGHLALSNGHSFLEIGKSHSRWLDFSLRNIIPILYSQKLSDKSHSHSRVAKIFHIVFILDLDSRWSFSRRGLPCIYSEAICSFGKNWVTQEKA